jgi:hypothetical protein
MSYYLLKNFFSEGDLDTGTDMHIGTIETETSHAAASQGMSVTASKPGVVAYVTWEAKAGGL